MTQYIWRFKGDCGTWTTLHWTMTEEAAREWAAQEGREIERMAERRADPRLASAPRRSGHNLAEMDQFKRDRRHFNRDRRGSSSDARDQSQIILDRRQSERRSPLEYPGF